MGQRSFGCHVPGIFAYANPWYLGLVGSAVFNWAVSEVLAGKIREAKGNGRRPAGVVKERQAGVGWFWYLAYAPISALLFTLKYKFLYREPERVSGKDMPLQGFSFRWGSAFTFQRVAWLVDSFCMETGDYSFGIIFCLPCVFQRAMGPILLHGEFMPQQDPSP